MLEHGVAYGEVGTALQGKMLMSTITTGGGREAYRKEGHNRFTVREFLAPYKIPQYIEFRDMLPKSKVGKLLRREIRDEEKRMKDQ